MYYIATFYSHFGAIRFQRECRREGMQAQLMPVPRDLSSSCGTCVRFMAQKQVNPSHFTTEEMEKMVRETETGYEVIFE